MEIQSIMVTLKPDVKGIDQIILHGDSDNRWGVEAWFTTKAATKDRIYFTKSISLISPFNALLYSKYIPKSDYFTGTLQDMIDMVSAWNLKAYKQYKDRVIYPDGMIVEAQFDLSIINQDLKDLKIRLGDLRI